MLARAMQRVIPRVATPSVACFGSLHPRTPLRSISNVAFHGMVDSSIFDIHFKHVILEFPESSNGQLGKRFLLKFAEHYEEDLWHGIGNWVTNTAGSASVDAHGQVLALEMEECHKIVHDVKTFVPAEERFSDEIVPLAQVDWQHSSPATARLEGITPNVLPNAIVLSLREAEGEMVEYRLTPTTREALSKVVPGVYPSGNPAHFLREQLLSKI